MLLICQQRFLFNVFYVFYFFHKRVFNVFYFGGQLFFTSMTQTVVAQICSRFTKLFTDSLNTLTVINTFNFESELRKGCAAFCDRKPDLIIRIFANFMPENRDKNYYMHIFIKEILF